MLIKMSDCQGGVASRRYMTTFLLLISRADSTSSNRSMVAEGACANCHLNGYLKACSLEHAFQIQL
jgi:hypothetical protein